MTLIVNMIGGPGTGKSTTAAATFAQLKYEGVNAELVTEYAKDIVWGRLHPVLEDQLYIFAKQHRRIHRLIGQVDVIVTDCPLFLSVYYGEKMSSTFKQLVLETFNEYENWNFFLNRVKEYNPKGRTQTEEHAKEIDQILYNLLMEYDIDFDIVTADKGAPSQIASAVRRHLAQVGSVQ